MTDGQTDGRTDRGSIAASCGKKSRPVMLKVKSPAWKLRQSEHHAFINLIEDFDYII